MSSSDEEVLSRERIRERAEAGEPIVEPSVLRQWADADLPLRGKIRKRLSARLANEVAERRTFNSITSRLADNISSPITNAIRQEINERIQERAAREFLNREQ